MTNPATVRLLRSDAVRTRKPQVAELEDDLAAARTSLRRMIRNENRD